MDAGKEGKRLLLVGALLTLVLMVQAALFTPGCGKQAEKGQLQQLPSLQAKLDSMKAAFHERAPDDLIADYEMGLLEMQQRRVGAAAPLVGARAPELTLPDHKGRRVELRELLAEGPVVLVWYRGGWCPYCNAQLAALEQALPAIRAAGGQLVAVSPNLPDKAAGTVRDKELSFTVLSDTGNVAAREWGLLYQLPEPVARRYAASFDFAEWNGYGAAELPLTPAYVIDRDGMIRYAFLSLDYRKRAEPSELVEVLEGLN